MSDSSLSFSDKRFKCICTACKTIAHYFPVEVKSLNEENKIQLNRITMQKLIGKRVIGYAILLNTICSICCKKILKT